MNRSRVKDGCAAHLGVGSSFSTLLGKNMHKKNNLSGILFSLLAALSIAVACGDDDIEVLECTGSCSCDQETRTCSCSGGTTCTIEGAKDITFKCDGNAACNLACGENCHVICPGTTGCTVTLGNNSTAECQGNAVCNYDCEGNCEAECGGASTCNVTCADGCTLSGNTCSC